MTDFVQTGDYEFKLWLLVAMRHPDRLAHYNLHYHQLMAAVWCPRFGAPTANYSLSKNMFLVSCKFKMFVFLTNNTTLHTNLIEHLLFGCLMVLKLIVVSLFKGYF